MLKVTCVTRGVEITWVFGFINATDLSAQYLGSFTITSNKSDPVTTLLFCATLSLMFFFWGGGGAIHHLKVSLAYFGR